MAFVFCKKQTSSFCMYINVIYFFVMHETFIRTVFEMLAKNTFPSFHASRRKNSPYITFLTNLEDEIIFKGGRICNTHFVIARNNTSRGTISLYVSLIFMHHLMWTSCPKTINKNIYYQIMHHARFYSVCILWQHIIMWKRNILISKWEFKIWKKF